MFSDSRLHLQMLYYSYFFLLKLEFVLLFSVIYLVLEFEPKKSKPIFPLYFICFFVAVMKCPDKSNLKKEETIFAYTEGIVYQGMGAKAAATCVTSTVMEQSELNKHVSAQLTFSISMVQDLPAQGMVPPTVARSSSLKLEWR